MCYNFARVHHWLRVSPVIGAKVAVHVWTIEEIVLAAAESARTEAA